MSVKMTISIAPYVYQELKAEQEKEGSSNFSQFSEEIIRKGLVAWKNEQD